MKRFMRWLRVDRTPPAPTEPAEPLANAPEPVAEQGHDAITRQVVERLSEDEALRRDLTDDAFKPILDLVTSLVPAAAVRASAQPDAAEQLSQSARQLVQGLSAAVASGDPSVVSADLLHRFMSEDEAKDALQRLATGKLPDGSDGSDGARAEAIVGTVKAALKRGRA
jgi:hypothetical protein